MPADHLHEHLAPYPLAAALTSHIAYNMSDGKICDTVTTNILRLESDDGLTGWGEVCPIPHYLPAMPTARHRPWPSWHR